MTNTVNVESVVRYLDWAIEQGLGARHYINGLKEEYGIIDSHDGGFKIIDEQKYMLFLLRWA